MPADKEYEKLKRHLGSKVPVEISTGDKTDTFYFKRLSFKQYAKCMTLSKYIDYNDPTNIDPEVMNEMFDVLVEIVKRSYPNWEDELVEQFVDEHPEEMMQAVQKLMPQSNNQTNPKDIKQLKKNLEFINNVKTDEKANNKNEKKEEDNVEENNVKQQGHREYQEQGAVQQPRDQGTE